MKRAVLIALCALTAATLLTAQEWKGQGRIPGIVVDQQGNPLEGVRVKLFCPKCFCSSAS